ncbi:hypothetical protein PIB30_080254 [Stylosanthes scabra]|uniref:Uncharacterized protein n=1 Tax=Stylosanthes scabra TaxID=79078 RepID=A0ABU6SRL4_9FABA|nr:hypothetical protein [Stylosanthes scabra]
MRRNLVGQVDAAEDAGEEAAGDMPMPDTQSQPTIGTSSQVPTETEVSSQEQSDVIEFVRKGFEEMRTMMTEGFTSFKGEDVMFDPPEHQDGAPAQD